MMLSKWYYFLIALIVTLIYTYLYDPYLIPTYRVSTTLLIDEEKKGGLLGDTQLLKG